MSLILSNKENWPENVGSTGAHPTALLGQGAKPAAYPKC